MSDLGLRALISFSNVMKNFLGNRWAENYKELVEKLLVCQQDIGTKMIMKVHFLHSHQDEFPDNCGDINDEQRKWFH